MSDQTPPERRMGPYETSLYGATNSDSGSGGPQRRRSGGAHRASRPTHPGRGRGLLIGALALGLVAAGGITAYTMMGEDTPAPVSATGARQTTARCPQLSYVTVWTSPSTAAAIDEVSRAYEAKPNSLCVDFVVESRSPIEAMIGLGPGQPGRPSAWIAESGSWVDRLNNAAKLNLPKSDPFAVSPIVVAMDPKKAATIGSDPTWQKLLGSSVGLRVPDPRTNTEGMFALYSAVPNLPKDQTSTVIKRLSERVATATPELFAQYQGMPDQTNAFVTSEAALLEHNRTVPASPMAEIHPAGGVPALEYSVVNTANEPAKRKAVQDLAKFLRSPEAAPVLASRGLRPVDGSVVPPSPAATVGAMSLKTTPTLTELTAAEDAWQSLTIDFNLLVVFDVSGSMKESTEGSTRIAITKEAAGIALAALPPTTNIGVWAFSINLGAGTDWKVLTPIATVAEPSHRKEVAASVTGLDKMVGGGTGLHDTILAAYQEVLAKYDPSRVNAVVLLTDGRNEDANGISYEELKAKLKALSDPKKPVALVTIGIGRGADGKQLAELSKMSHSNYYSAPKASDITGILAKALFDHTCSEGVCA